MKKLIAFLLVLTMVICLLVSCGGKSSKSTDSSGKGLSGKTSNTSQTTEQSSTTSKEKNGETNKSTKTGSVTPSFKKTMDDYEKFMDDYIAILKTYQQNPSDFSVLLRYTQMLSQYETVMNEIDSIDTDQLSEADYAYYLTVTLRVTNKLAGSISE